MTSAPQAAGAPTYSEDLFTDEALADGLEHYRAMRELGPVV